MAGTVRIEMIYDQAEYRALMLKIRSFDRRLYLLLRRNLRAAAQPVLNDIKEHIQSGSYQRDTGMRAGLAAGQKVSLRTGVRSAGVTFRSSGSGLPANKQPLVKAWNKGSFRHPVLGNREKWVSQSGNPYFSSVIYPHRAQFEAAVQAALREAAAGMG